MKKTADRGPMGLTCTGRAQVEGISGIKRWMEEP